MYKLSKQLSSNGGSVGGGNIHFHPSVKKLNQHGLPSHEVRYPNRERRGKRLPYKPSLMRSNSNNHHERGYATSRHRTNENITHITIAEEDEEEDIEQDSCEGRYGSKNVVASDLFSDDDVDVDDNDNGSNNIHEGNNSSLNLFPSTFSLTRKRSSRRAIGKSLISHSPARKSHSSRVELSSKAQTSKTSHNNNNNSSDNNKLTSRKSAGDDEGELSFFTYLYRLLDVWDLDYEYIGWCVLGLIATLLTVYVVDQVSTKLGHPIAETGLFDMVWLRVPDLIIGLLCAIPGIIFKVYADMQVLQSETSLQFLTLVNFSLNWIETDAAGGDLLSFATVNEVKLDMLSHMNSSLQKKVLQEAVSVPPEHPVLFCERSTVGKVLKKSAQNVISTQFASGNMHRAFNESVRALEVVVAYTFEKDERVPQRKIRVMLCPIHLIARILQDPSPPRFKRPAHAPRWDTLLEIANLYKQKSPALAYVTVYSTMPSVFTSRAQPSIY
eukprot:m.55889 g.55889  ORF g.55889 m.55889 type:complete len:497 (-) comp11156_c0_seq1:1286-2776(-)